MELLLNLAWLLLALPAYWLWRKNKDRDIDERCYKDTRGLNGANSYQCLLALGCALVLLFPVISATDDLHAMRAEMEDSATSKRAVRQAGDKSSAWTNRWQGPSVGVPNASHIAIPNVHRFDPFEIHLPVLASSSVLHAGRAPPLFG